MNDQVARYATLRFQPYPNRSEHLNFGIVVFLPEGGANVHLTALSKLRPLAKPEDIAAIHKLPADVAELVRNQDFRQALAALNGMRILRAVDEQALGAFSFSNAAEYAQQVKLALQSQCSVESHARRTREPKSRLYLDVKQRFKAIGILGQVGEFPDHRVVEHYSPDPDVDVKVEFALQNGLLRVAQTMDLRGDYEDVIRAPSRSAAFSKAYAIHATKTSLPGVHSFVIVAGADSSAAKKILAPIEKDADQVVHWEDKDEMTSFFMEWALAAGKPLPSIPVN